MSQKQTLMSNDDRLTQFLKMLNRDYVHIVLRDYCTTYGSTCGAYLVRNGYNMDY
ncbi:hypothetical protein IJ732_02310 [bacterium]|nr:hypothetical protein [bacterium]